MESILNNPLFKPSLMALVVVCLMPLIAGYLTLVERKVLADFQVRLGPMRTGPHGLLQPLADALKLILKEDVIPSQSDKVLFWFAPVVTTCTALTAFSVLPFTGFLRGTDVNVGLLVIASMSALGVLGIVLGGWASNSHYSLLGALRSGAQLISYEIAIAFSLLCGVMAAGTLSMEGIVKAQADRHVWFVFSNFGLMIVPFITYLIAGIAETNRAPFDLPEAESELVAGFHTEYSGFRWALYFLGEYCNVVVIASVAVTLFWGGWLRPFPSVVWLEIPMNYGVPVLALAGTGIYCFPLSRGVKSPVWRVVLMAIGLGLIVAGGVFLIPVVNSWIIGLFWFALKLSCMIYAMIWFRATWPRLRYDQLMNIGWKRLIPIGMAAVMVNAVVGMVK
jgi:NADH-quinone oxidoreductase subunit H